MLPVHQNDQEFLRILHRHEPVTVQELCAITGVTATAVRQRLNRFEERGWIERRVAHQQRGRPHHTYSLTEAGLKTLGNDQAEMAALLWRHVMQIESPEIKNKLLSDLKQSLVRRFGGVDSEEELSVRLKRMCDSLAGFGFDIESITGSASGADQSDVGQGGSFKSSEFLPVLREYNCPYHEIALEDPSFCDFERSVFAEILGAEVRQSVSRFDGHCCCEFEVSEAGQI
jgi:predicted ArsR family transcriptional regulator